MPHQSRAAGVRFDLPFETVTPCWQAHRMCPICDGFTLDEVLARLAAEITHEGFVLQGVGDPSGPSWIYTIGLLDAAGHPEMILAGAGPEPSARLMHQLAAAVIDGERFQVGETIAVGSEVARVGAVHPVQYGLSTFANWHNLLSEGVLRERKLSAVQVFPPPSWNDRHGAQPNLALPWARVGALRPRPRRPNSRIRRHRH